MANLPRSGVVAGAAATFSLLMALEGFRWWFVLPYVHDATTEPRRGAGGNVVRTWTSGEQ